MKAHRCLMFLTQIFAWFAGLLFSPLASAQYRYDEVTVARLPPYCRNAATYRDRIAGGNNPAEIERWLKVMGRGFIHIHHYCQGLQLTSFALFESKSKEDRNHALRLSIGEFDYVIARVDSTFSLLPEILTKKGQNLFRLEKEAQAITMLLKAIEVRSDYWPPYASLSDHYKEIGNLDEARNWLKRGLSASGGAKALERRLKELPPN